MNPLVSVTIPSYNHGRYLSQAVESVLDQTYEHIELIIVDDGSTDDSLSIALGYAKRFPRKISVHTHPDGRNHGIAKTSNACRRLIKGKYWSGLASDDILLPYKIAKQVEFLESHPDCCMVYSTARRIDENGNVLDGLMGREFRDPTDPLMSLLVENPINAITTLLHREIVEAIGPQDESLVFEDWDLWLRIASEYKIGFMREPTVLYRVHRYNSSLGKPLREIRNTKAVFSKWLRAPAGTPLAAPKYNAFIRERLREMNQVRSNALIDKGIQKARRGDTSRACKAFRRAWQVSARPFYNPRRLAAVLKYLIWVRA